MWLLKKPAIGGKGTTLINANATSTETILTVSLMTTPTALKPNDLIVYFPGINDRPSGPAECLFNTEIDRHRYFPGLRLWASGFDVSHHMLVADGQAEDLSYENQVGIINIKQPAAVAT